MAIRANDQQVLDDLYAQYKSAYGGAKQDYFALAYLRKRFKIEIDDLKYRVAFNGNDYGIDAYFIDGEAHNLYLYQFKWTENYALFKDSMVRLTNYGIDRVFGNPTQDTTQNELIVYLKKELNEDRDKISRVYIHFVFKGDVDACEKSEGLANRREDLESKAHVINTYFGREIEVHVDFISDKPGKKPPPPAQSYEITLSEHIKTAHDRVAMYVAFIPLHELHGIYVALRERLFDRNIRGALSSDNAPNRRIRGALERIVLKDADQPSVFPFRHNGVTIAAEKVTVVDGRLSSTYRAY